MKEDIRIAPTLESEGLMFRFDPPSHVLDVSKDSNSYKFIHCMLDKMYPTSRVHPKAIV